MCFPGAEGGSKMCYWSERLRTCFPPSFQYIACHTGDCGIVYNEASICPAMCSSQTICNRCNQIDNCGWCASPGIMGIGVCQDGGLEGSVTLLHITIIILNRNKLHWMGEVGAAPPLIIK